MTDPAPPGAMVAAAGRPRIAVLADDLMWATRLTDRVRAVGGQPVAVRSERGLADVLASVAGCVVDTAGRTYDGIAAIRAATAVYVPVLAIGHHDDAATRHAAVAAGASRVYSYRALFEHGDRVLERWLATIPAAVP